MFRKKILIYPHVRLLGFIAPNRKGGVRIIIVAVVCWYQLSEMLARTFT